MSKIGFRHSSGCCQAFLTRWRRRLLRRKSMATGREDKQLKEDRVTRTKRDKGRERRRETAREGEGARKKEIGEKERQIETDARGGRYNERERERRDEERLSTKSGVLDRGKKERKKRISGLSHWETSYGNIYKHFCKAGKPIDETTDWRELEDTEKQRAFYNKVTRVIRRTIPRELKFARDKADPDRVRTVPLLEHIAPLPPQYSHKINLHQSYVGL